MRGPTILETVAVDQRIFIEVVFVYFLALDAVCRETASDQVQVAVGDRHRFVEFRHLECNIELDL